MQIVTIDFETYWAKDFSLRSKDLNMSEYVLDDQFSVHMMGIKIDDRPVKVVNGADVQAELASIRWEDSALLCQNTAFDGFILSQHFGVIPAFYYDTLSMGRGAFSVAFPLGLDDLATYCGFEGKMKDVLPESKGVRVLPPELWERMARYCARDVDLTYKVFRTLHPAYPQEELELIDLTLRMFCDPVLRVDINRVEAALAMEVGKKVAALFKAQVSAEDLLSNVKFDALLKREGLAASPMKISLTTNKPTFAFAKTDAWMLENRDHPKWGPLIQARLAIKSTIGETRAERLLNVGDGKLPVLLNYCGAHTTRWSAGNKMNLQNLPRKGELRKSILAPEGHVVVVADSAQIEARVLAWLAGHTILLELFRAKQDVYSWMAAKVYGKLVADVTPEERFIGKVLVLALGYGMGADKLKDTLAKGALGAAPVKIAAHVADDWVFAYRDTNAPIVALWKDMSDALPLMVSGEERVWKCLEFIHNAIVLPNGLALHYPELAWRTDAKTKRSGYSYMTRGKPTKIYGGLLTENVVQALARCIVAEQMRVISKQYRVVTMTHDEIVCVAKTEDAQACLDFMIQTMKTPPTWAPDLPLGAEGGFDTMYSK